MSFQNQGEAITPVKILANYYRGMKYGSRNYHTNSYFYPETLTHNSKPQLETSTRKLNSKPQLETSTRNPNSKPPTRNLNSKPQLETSTRTKPQLESRNPNCTRHLNSKPELEPYSNLDLVQVLYTRYNTGTTPGTRSTELKRNRAPMKSQLLGLLALWLARCGADLGSVPRPDLGPTSAVHWWTGDFQYRFGPSPPISPPRDRAHMTSDRALITGLVSRFSVVNSHFSSISSFTLHVHLTGKLGESYLRIRQCPNHQKISEKISEKPPKPNRFIINPSLIYIQLYTVVQLYEYMCHSYR